MMIIYYEKALKNQYFKGNRNTKKSDGSYILRKQPHKYQNLNGNRVTKEV